MRQDFQVHSIIPIALFLLRTATTLIVHITEHLPKPRSRLFAAAEGKGLGGDSRVLGQRDRAEGIGLDKPPPLYAQDLEETMSEDDDEPLEGLQGFENVLVRCMISLTKD